MIVVNFKTYPIDSFLLARTCEEVARESGKRIIACPQHADLRIAREAKVEFFAQHVDPVEGGQSTGSVTAESVKNAGCAGTLLNHSEKRMRLADIDLVVRRCRSLGLTTIVCTNNIPVSAACASLNPDCIAIEPPELIGGEVSVTTASPNIIREAVQAVSRVNPAVAVLCGAGVKNGRDVARALELGATGVLVASGVTKAKDPKAALADLVSGLG